jgi:hypothetical protein
MTAYEYRIEHRPAGTRMGPMNDRLDVLAQEGWEPIMMTGDNELYIMMRRPKRETAQPQRVAEATGKLPAPNPQ